MTSYGCIHSIRTKVEKSWVAGSYLTTERECMIQSGHSEHHACNGVHLLQICVWPSCVTPVTVNDGMYYVASLQCVSRGYCNRATDCLQYWWHHLGGDLHTKVCHDIQVWVIYCVCYLYWSCAGHFWKVPCIYVSIHIH